MSTSSLLKLYPTTNRNKIHFFKHTCHGDINPQKFAIRHPCVHFRPMNRPTRKQINRFFEYCTSICFHCAKENPQVWIFLKIRVTWAIWSAFSSNLSSEYQKKIRRFKLRREVPEQRYVHFATSEFIDWKRISWKNHLPHCHGDGVGWWDVI